MRRIIDVHIELRNIRFPNVGLFESMRIFIAYCPSYRVGSRFLNISWVIRFPFSRIIDRRVCGCGAGGGVWGIGGMGGATGGLPPVPPVPLVWASSSGSGSASM